MASQKEPNSSERPASPASSKNEGHVELVFHVSFCVGVTFVVIYAAYGLVRAVELLLTDDAYYALPVLCTAAPLLLTRIAFTLMPDNIVFIALHAMMRDFTRLTFIAIWCFAGFVMGLPFLARTSGDASVSVGVTWATITKWLLWIWFGLDGIGIERAADFHLILGPTLIITFAFLGNTLFLTIVVAILTNTFSRQPHL